MLAGAPLASARFPKTRPEIERRLAPILRALPLAGQRDYFDLKGRVAARTSGNGKNIVGRFASTVAFYERARQPYGEAFFAEVARTLGFRGSQRLLDLGAGPGLLAIGFAAFVGEIVGVDPEPAMIEAARQAAERAGVALRLVVGRAESLPEDIGTFDVVTIGRALHWMDPDPTRAALGRVVAPNGRILVCRASSVADIRNPWLGPYEAVRDAWTQKAGKRHYGRDPAVFFAGTRFRHDRTIRVEMEHMIALERLIDRVLSMSSSSPARLGDDVETMREAMAEALAPFARNGLVKEVVEARAEVFRSD